MPVYIAHRFWFTFALASELADAEIAVETAGSPTAGAAGRVAAAMQNLEDLERFIAELEDLKRTNGFRSLKKATSSRRNLVDYHVLEIGNYRGYFAVDDAAVYQALLSRAPHDQHAIVEMQTRMKDFYDALRKFEGS